MRCIDADVLEKEGWSLHRTVRVDSHTMEYQTKPIAKVPTVEPELVWHECFDEDPNSFPDDSRNVLVSFSNFSLSIIGQWRHDPDEGGCWYLGDTDETFISEGLFVDGWWELPEKPERSN